MTVRATLVLMLLAAAPQCAVGQEMAAAAAQEPAAFAIHRWVDGAKGCELRMSGGAQLKSMVRGDVELSVAFASNRRQYWLYLAITNHGEKRIVVHPSSFQLLSVAPYERQMLYRSSGDILSVTRSLSNGDAAYSGTPMTLPPAAALYESPDFSAMNRAFQLLDKTPSDATELALHLNERLLGASSIQPGEHTAGFVLFEQPPPVRLPHHKVERQWDPVALLLTVRIGGVYWQIPIDADR